MRPLVHRPRVLELAQAGTAPSEIARQTGLHRQQVSSMIFSARRKGQLIPRFSSAGEPITGANPPRNIAFQIDHDLALILFDEAARRGMSSGRLATELVRTALRDDLVDAIIDQ